MDWSIVFVVSILIIDIVFIICWFEFTKESRSKLQKKITNEMYISNAYRKALMYEKPLEHAEKQISNYLKLQNKDYT